ncbi:cytochrome P450 [Azohydromonas lata]|uniref:cytochrome P450 n=1 Tax=Azohydromonas lata TaxID=45677 RepID=UPI001EE4989B|nr:cytochrome P450 [Azohydromonas lata]
MTTTSSPHGATAAASAPSAEHPGVPGRWWGLPVLLAMYRDFLGAAQARHKAHGDLCRMRIGGHDVYDLFAPDLVPEALVDQAERLVRHPPSIAVLKRCFGLGEGVITTEGDI